MYSSSMDRAIIKLVIDRVAEGYSLRKIMEEHGVHPGTFIRALGADTELEQEYNLAQQIRSEQLVEEIIEIADTDHDPIRARVRIDARKWYASKMRPSKYGDKLDINVHQVVDIRGAIEAARARSIEVIEPIVALIDGHSAANEIDIFS